MTQDPAAGGGRTAGSRPSRAQLEAAIAAQEGLRATLGDELADATIGALRAQLAALDEAAEVAQQRKLVSVLFMDIVRSTDLIQGRDPEEAMSILDVVLTRLGQAVTAHGGRVVKFMGDGFMAAFGLPAARENDPEMAVRAGLAIVRTAAELAPDLASEHGASGFAVRVGINTGLVAVGGLTEAEDTIIGDAVNLAARLEHAARPGGVLISRGTHQHVRGLFELEDGGSIEAKGFPDPVPVYHVLGRATGAAGQPARGIEGVEIPMIGRQAELARLVAAADAVASSGAARVVTVLGDAGLGKSRLLDELRGRLAGMGFLTVEGRATLETQQLPYGMLRDLLERRFRIRVGDDADAARAGFVEGIVRDLGDGPDSERHAHVIAQLVGYDLAGSPHVRGLLDAPQQLRNRAAMYLAGLIAALAERQPVAMLLEDLHWADAGSLDLLEGLAGPHVLVAATARPSLLEVRPGWGSSEGHETIRLAPLSDAEIEELSGAALALVADLPEDLVQRLVAQAGGSPYYLEESIRMLVDDGVIHPGDGAWTIDRSRTPELRIPATLTGVIQARLDGLPHDDRLALQRAAVVGRVFWDAIVERLASADVHEVDVAPTLAALERREMVHARPASMFPDVSEYAFHHEILQSVAYEGVLLRTRREYHSAVADWLVARRGGGGPELGGQIAHHLERAGRSAEALAYLIEAAEAALAAHAAETADELYARALALVPPDEPRTRFALLLGREQTLGMRERPDEQRGVLDELAGLAGSDVDIATVGTRRAWFHYFSGEFAQAAEVSRSAVEAARRAGDPGLECLGRRALATSLLAVDDVDAAGREAEQALSLARAARDAWTEMKVVNTLGLIAVVRADLSVARRHLEAYLAMARDQGSLDEELTATNNLATVLTQLGRYPQAREHFEHVRAIAGEAGDRFMEATALVNLAWVAASDGRWADACDLARQGIARKRATQQRDAVAEGLVWLAHAEVGLDEPQAAVADYADALRIREELGQTALAMAARAGLARAELAHGDDDAAWSHASQVVRHLDDGGTLEGDWEPLRTHLACVEVLLARGEPDAPRVLERAHRALLASAARIEDEEDRRLFLEQVPWHRRILELAGDAADRRPGPERAARSRRRSTHAG